MLKKILVLIFGIGLFARIVMADEVIYTLDDDWTYEERTPGTLSLSVNRVGGINVVIDIPSGHETGGLEASIHTLPGFSISTDAYVELEFSSLDYTVTGTDTDTHLSLCLELEFSDADGSTYQMAMSVGANSQMTAFVTWYEDDTDGQDQVIPTSISIQEGSIGLYFHDNYVSPYFRNSLNQITYPFTDWDISNIVVPQSFAVDNDFEGDTLGGGTVSGSVNLKRVVFGPGAPPYQDETTQYLVSEIYVATFGRAPAYAGLTYWTNAVEAGDLSIEQVAQSFFDQPETKARFPEGSSNTELINAVFYNTLSRVPAAAGLDYWVDALDHGVMRRDQAIMAIINGAKAATGSSEDAAMLAKKTEIGVYFAHSEAGSMTDNENFMDWATNIISFSASDDFNIEEAEEYILELLSEI